MNGEFGRIFLILSLGILIVCLPAQAAHAGQAGSSSPLSDHGAQVNLSSGSSTGSPPDSVGKVSGIHTGSSVSSQSFVQTGPEVTASGKALDSPGTADESSQSGPVNAKTGSSLHQLSQEPIPADLISVITVVLKQPETWDLHRDQKGKV